MKKLLTGTGTGAVRLSRRLLEVRRPDVDAERLGRLDLERDHPERHPERHADRHRTGTSTAGATAGPIDQTTPEAAMTSWLGAMVAGDGNSVCALMATKGKTISSIPGAAATCGKTITPMLDQIKELGAAFQGLKITGATVNGDTASFESVTTEPALAADVVASFKAVRIGGKWYVTQG